MLIPGYADVQVLSCLTDATDEMCVSVAAAIRAATAPAMIYKRCLINEEDFHLCCGPDISRLLVWLTCFMAASPCLLLCLQACLSSLWVASPEDAEAIIELPSQSMSSSYFLEPKNLTYLKFFTSSSLLTAPSCHLHKHVERPTLGSAVRNNCLHVLQARDLTPGFICTTMCRWACWPAVMRVGLETYTMRCCLSRLSEASVWMGMSRMA